MYLYSKAVRNVIENDFKGSAKFDEFWAEVDKLFDEYTASVHERRSNTGLYLPFAISIGDLIKRVKVNLWLFTWAALSIAFMTII